MASTAPVGAGTSPLSSPATDDALDSGIFSDEECVKVCCRIRPQNALELAKDSESCLTAYPDGKTIRITNRDMTDNTFKFDKVFPEYTDQQTMYENLAKPLVAGVLNGINGAVLAYGQTGSGKTYTMEGVSGDEELSGIIPRLFEEMFTTMDGYDNVEFDIRASFIEIYNEVLHDLLAAGRGGMQIFEDQKRGLVITGASEVPVRTLQEVTSTYRQGLANRRTAETKMNRDSSRGHAIFLLTVARQETLKNVTKFSQLYLVDLAGSEKVWKTGAEGKRLDEAKFINKSLLALGQVIYKLSTKDAKHIPYRDSKLTRLLQNSLGGNARTVLNINVSPSTWNAQETLSTLRFGDRTKRITNKPVQNEVMGIEELEGVLADAHRRITVNAATIAQLEAQRAQFRDLFQALGMTATDIALMEQQANQSRRSRTARHVTNKARNGGQRRKAAGSAPATGRATTTGAGGYKYPDPATATAGMAVTGVPAASLPPAPDAAAVAASASATPTPAPPAVPGSTVTGAVPSSGSDGEGDLDGPRSPQEPVGMALQRSLRETRREVETARKTMDKLDAARQRDTGGKGSKGSKKGGSAATAARRSSSSSSKKKRGRRRTRTTPSPSQRRRRRRSNSGGLGGTGSDSDASRSGSQASASDASGSGVDTSASGFDSDVKPAPSAAGSFSVISDETVDRFLQRRRKAAAEQGGASGSGVGGGAGARPQSASATASGTPGRPPRSQSFLARMAKDAAERLDKIAAARAVPSKRVYPGVLRDVAEPSGPVSALDTYGGVGAGMDGAVALTPHMLPSPPSHPAPGASSGSGGGGGGGALAQLTSTGSFRYRRSSSGRPTTAGSIEPGSIGRRPGSASPLLRRVGSGASGEASLAVVGQPPAGSQPSLITEATIVAHSRRPTTTTTTTTTSSSSQSRPR